MSQRQPASRAGQKQNIHRAEGGPRRSLGYCQLGTGRWFTSEKFLALHSSALKSQYMVRRNVSLGAVVVRIDPGASLSLTSLLRAIFHV
ncbi:hypothetical protein RRG08_062297 [Elysia crispata]|uniref:Uncharacterized protein n=1 Tax=Elysia crispata TaxID=231223 RepID=A0AAE1CYW5_9GAST|nr:hypothetical protein RRG08_062297 [Elysia crispata]